MENNENSPINEQEQPVENNAAEATTDNSTEQTENNTNIEQENTEAKIAELNDKYLRLYSEFDNYRKRTLKERAELIKSANEDVLKAILPVIDDFERAIKANELINEAVPIKEGISLIYNKLKNIGIQKGLEPMESIGTPFNADIMEAITHIPSPSEDMKGKVIDEVEKGYKLGDKVIRYAKVVVGN